MMTSAQVAVTSVTATTGLNINGRSDYMLRLTAGSQPAENMFVGFGFYRMKFYLFTQSWARKVQMKTTPG